MIMKELNHNSNYEFQGKFWFLDKPESLLSGKLVYSPEKGIKLELLNLFTSSPIKLKASKVLHAALVINKELEYFTLFDVFLNSSITYSNRKNCQYINGSARALIWGKLLNDKQIKSLKIEYDEYFKSIIYEKGQEITEAIQYEKKPLKTSKGKIRLDTNFCGQFISSKEDVDELLWIYQGDHKVLSELKKHIWEVIKKDTSILCKRTTSYSTVSFENGNKIFNNYLKIEKIWRSFWELLNDHPITVSRAWVHVSDYENNKKKYYTYCPVLFSNINKTSQKRQSEFCHKNFLPINIDEFGKLRDLSKVFYPFTKWLDMNNDKKLYTLMTGISKIIYKKDFITADDYISLISYIETAMDFLGKRENKVETLIQHYADKKWLSSIQKIIGKAGTKDKTAKFLSEVRNVIIHPKSAMKTGGIYLNFAMDDIKLQAAYAYLVGLLMKAIMQYLYDFDKNKLNEYIKKVISSRRYYKIIYK